LQFLFKVGKPALSRDRRSTEQRGEGGRTEKGRTLKCWLKFLPSLPLSAATREEKAEGGEQQSCGVITGWKCCRGEQALLGKLS